MGQSPSITLNCPAKINLALSVGVPNPDGLHPLASWMIAVGFADSLALEKIDTGFSQFDIVPANQSSDTTAPAVHIDWPIENDLAFRAHALLQKQIDKPLPIKLALRKRIPTGGGLGGGSSNAAATLVGLNRLFSLGLGDADLIRLGQQLGSDVSFLIGAILGRPSALVTGLGEQLEPLPDHRPIHLLLIFPTGLACPTGQVYAAFDQLNRSQPPTGPDVDRVRQVASLALQSNLPADAPFNDLQQPAFAVQPRLEKIHKQLEEQLHRPVHVTGSGSTLFVITDSADTCQSMASQASSLDGVVAVATQTLSPQ